MKLLPLSIRIPLGLTIAVLMVGIVLFVKRATGALQIPTLYVVIWIVVLVILSGITVWSWQRNKRK